MNGMTLKSAVLNVKDGQPLDRKLKEELDKHEPESLHTQGTYLNALLYGDWGVGKTTLALSSGRPTLIISSGDGGESVVRNLPGDQWKQTNIVQCQGLSHIRAIFEAITEGHSKYSAYEVVVIDTVSAICDQYLNNLVTNFSTSTGQKDRHIAIPRSGGERMEAEGMGDYKFLASHMRALAPVSSKAPVDKVWIAHEREPTFMDEAKGNYLTRPKMPERASDALAEVCHVVGLVEKKKGKRTINFNGSDRLAAKSRIKSLEDKTIQVDAFWPEVEKWKKEESK